MILLWLHGAMVAVFLFVAGIDLAERDWLFLSVDIAMLVINAVLFYSKWRSQ